MFITKRPDAQRANGCITYRGRDMEFTASILPGTDAPHVGADSPRHLEPPRPPVVFTYAILGDNGLDITNIYWYHRREIEALILAQWKAEQAGVVA